MRLVQPLTFFETIERGRFTPSLKRIDRGPGHPTGTLVPAPAVGYTQHVKQVACLLNEMMLEEIILDYAVFGAVAQMRYTEAVVTLDADVLVTVPDARSIDVLTPLYSFCRKRGYLAEGEAIRVGEWPVQLIPTFSPLTKEAVRTAETGDVDGVPLRVVRADYLAVIALSVGRAKDLARVVALREASAAIDQEIEALAAEHGLGGAWERFKERFRER